MIENKKIRFDYSILETIEAGISLLGIEVKSIRAGKASLKGSYAKIYNSRAYLVSAHISPYQEKNTPSDYDPERPRELLMHKKEIKYLTGKLKERGLTLMPLKLYNSKGKIKVELALAKSKKKFDKRDTIKKRDIERQIGRKLRN